MSTFNPPLRFWKRYADDTYTMLPVGLVSTFHKHLNKITSTFSSQWRRKTTGPFSFWMFSWHGIQTDLNLLQRDPHRQVSWLLFPLPFWYKNSVIMTLISCAKALSTIAVDCTKERSHVVVDQWVPKLVYLSTHLLLELTTWMSKLKKLLPSHCSIFKPCLSE